MRTIILLAGRITLLLLVHRGPEPEVEEVMDIQRRQTDVVVVVMMAELTKNCS